MKLEWNKHLRNYKYKHGVNGSHNVQFTKVSQTAEVFDLIKIIKGAVRRSLSIKSFSMRILSFITRVNFNQKMTIWNDNDHDPSISVRRALALFSVSRNIKECALFRALGARKAPKQKIRNNFIFRTETVSCEKESMLLVKLDEVLRSPWKISWGIGWLHQYHSS